jgi:membrane associated rhomboid family serine protease
VTEAPQTRSANYCYRHPDRPSWILCQRCGRTICPECQTQAAVGVHCPDCMRETRESAVPERRPIGRMLRPAATSTRPIVTWSIIGLTVAIYLLQQLTGDYVTQMLTYYPVLTPWLPWTMLTAVLVHASIMHIALNMLSLFVLGPPLEQMLGRIRFVLLYVIAGFGGSVAVLWLSPNGGVLGASGAIFGLLGALLVIQRGLGANSGQLVLILVLNLAVGFFLPGISWQAHVGGLIAGGLVALIFMRTRRRDQRTQQVLLLLGLVLLMIVSSVLGYIVQFVVA